MDYVLSALLCCSGILVLAVSGWLIAGWLARRKFWWAGLVPPLSLVCALVSERWWPGCLPVGWLVHGRREFMLMAFTIPLLLVTLSFHLNERRQVCQVQLLAALLTLYVSTPPFFGPVFEFSAQSKRETVIDENGVCIQGTGYNCGPAAAVTVLRRMGIPAEEGPLAIAAYTTMLSGTPADLLVAAVEDLHGVDGLIEYGSHIKPLAERTPFIAVVKHSWMVDHYVAVLGISSSTVRVGDPLIGAVDWPVAEFRRRWRGITILF